MYTRKRASERATANCRLPTSVAASQRSSSSACRKSCQSGDDGGNNRDADAHARRCTRARALVLTRLSGRQDLRHPLASPSLSPTAVVLTDSGGGDGGGSACRAPATTNERQREATTTTTRRVCERSTRARAKRESGSERRRPAGCLCRWPPAVWTDERTVRSIYVHIACVRAPSERSEPPAYAAASVAAVAAAAVAMAATAASTAIPQKCKT